MKTVNFIEAVNSNRKFKYEGDGTIMQYKGARLFCNGQTTGSYPNINDINSRFIIIDNEITLTETQLDEAINSFKDKCSVFDKDGHFLHMKAYLKKHLGLTNG